jgi:hypothetical protein
MSALGSRIFRASVLAAFAYACFVDIYLDVAAAELGGKIWLDVLTLGWPGLYVEIGVFAYATVGGIYFLGSTLRSGPLHRIPVEEWVNYGLGSLATAASLALGSLPFFWFVSDIAGGVVLGLSEVALVAAYSFIAISIVAFALDPAPTPTSAPAPTPPLLVDIDRTLAELELLGVTSITEVDRLFGELLVSGGP